MVCHFPFFQPEENTQKKRLTSLRGITRDPETYPSPEEFNPGRFLSPEYPTFRAPLTTYPNLSGFSQFGFGRRTCQGIPIVEQDLFLAMGGMAWAFDIRKKRDPTTGDEVPVHWNDYTPLLIAKPVRFEFDATPRDEGKVRRVREMWAVAKEEEEREEAEQGGYEFEFPAGGLDGGRVPGVEFEDPDHHREKEEGESEDERVRDSSPEPGLSFRDSSEEEEELDSEEEMELPIVFDKEGTMAWKTEPMMTVIEVPGAWRWA